MALQTAPHTCDKNLNFLETKSQPAVKKWAAQKNLPLNLLRSQIKSFCTSKGYFFKIHFIIILSSNRVFSKWCVIFRCSNSIFILLSFFVMLATCHNPSRVSWLYCIIIIIWNLRLWWLSIRRAEVVALNYVTSYSKYHNILFNSIWSRIHILKLLVT